MTYPPRTMSCLLNRTCREGESPQGGSQRCGIALLAVLALQVVAAILLAGAAGAGLDLGREAARREQEVRAFWGRSSLEEVLLPEAEALLDEVEQGSLRIAPAGSRYASIEQVVYMNGMRVEVRLADENAKLCFASLARIGGLPALQSALHGELRTRADIPLRTGELAAFLSGAATVDAHELAWGELIAVESCDERQTSDLADLAKRCTLWSGGLMNPGRATSEDVETMLQAVAGPAQTQRLLERYDPTVPGSLLQAAHAIHLPAPQIETLRRTFSDRSAVFSLEVRIGAQLLPDWSAFFELVEDRDPRDSIVRRLW